MFRAHVLIVRRSKLYYTASGIITLCRWLSRAQIERILSQSVHGTATCRCNDTRDCIIQFCPPDDEHMCSKHLEAWNKLIIKFSASSWLILINKYIELHGQQSIKKKYNCMFRPCMWAISRLWFNLQSSYTRCVGCSFGVLEVGWGERDLVVSIVGTMTWGCYKWIIISCLCTYVNVGYYSNAKDMLKIVYLKLGHMYINS